MACEFVNRPDVGRWHVVGDCEFSVFIRYLLSGFDISVDLETAVEFRAVDNFGRVEGPETCDEFIIIELFHRITRSVGFEIDSVNDSAALDTDGWGEESSGECFVDLNVDG